MKTFVLATIIFSLLNFLVSQPPGSPKNTPGSDTTTVESDGGNFKDTPKRSDTARNISNGPKPQMKKK